jgi:hypothetical protein
MKVPGEVAASPGFPLGAEPPAGMNQPTPNPHSSARSRCPRQRKCLRKGCGQIYRPQRWNQRYCQDAQCLRLVRRWKAAHRQARRRSTSEGRATHSQAERERRERLKSAAQVHSGATSACARGHAAKDFALPLCDRPGCHDRPRPSVRTKARYCSHACCNAVRRVRDRESKWKCRGTLEEQAKRQREYCAAQDRQRQARSQAEERRQPRAPPG